MGALEDLLKNDTGSMMISALLGFGLAAAMFKVCQGRDCIVTKGPNVKYVTSNIWKDGKNCYKYYVQSVDCPEKSNSDVESGRLAVPVS
ncbi:hypothetical protein TetV_269 [Tetraselmis virus 1]|uniref:Uncharacterized protein n=1 Tax=Tetraselmis virus 1 TaxID=2060617 RepID=A0A2P0VN96_9VIRU|nr:hypothetical protein QJ968_gp269 [Tetraselmis virus 1]AUF82361.1 hypothetical protein TetV_269 [Tetraselmis virus 1]